MGSTDDRPHVGQGLQVGVDVDRVEDAEELLADLGASAGRAADHLVVEDAAVDAAHEDEIADLRDVHAGGQQIDGDDVFRAAGRCGTMRIFGRAACRRMPVIFCTRSCGCGPYSATSALRSSSTRMSAWSSRAAKISVLPRRVGRDFARQRLGDDAVEFARVDPLVELVDFEIDLVGRREQVDLAGARVENLDLLAGFEGDAGLGQRGDDPARRQMVDQLAVNHGLAVAVAEDRRAEDLASYAGPGWR